MESTDIVASFLIHGCFKSTIDSFDQSAKSAKEVTTSILELAKKGKWFDIIVDLQKWLPEVLRANTVLFFDLLSLEYVVLLLSGDRINAVLFARKNFSLFSKWAMYHQRIEERLILLGCKAPLELSPRPYVLTDEYNTLVKKDLKDSIVRYLALEPLCSLKLRDEEIQELAIRKEILDSTVEGNGYQVRSLINEAFPGLLGLNGDLQVDILTLLYLDIVAANNIDQAVGFSKQHFASLLTAGIYRKRIERVMTTLSTEGQPGTLYKQTVRHRREYAAYKINKAIRGV